MRAVLDADIAYRAQQVTLGGISALLKDLHPKLQFDQSTIRINKTGHRTYDLEGNGLLLMPCVFAGSHIMFDPGSLGCHPLTMVPAASVPSGTTTAPPSTTGTRSPPSSGRAALPSCATRNYPEPPPTWPASLASAVPPSACTCPCSSAAAWSPHGVLAAASSTSAPPLPPASSQPSFSPDHDPLSALPLGWPAIQVSGSPVGGLRINRLCHVAQVIDELVIAPG